MGLCLHIVRIVEAHECRIERRSTPGRGTTMEVHFPATQPWAEMRPATRGARGA